MLIFNAFMKQRIYETLFFFFPNLEQQTISEKTKTNEMNPRFLPRESV